MNFLNLDFKQAFKLKRTMVNFLQLLNILNPLVMAQQQRIPSPKSEVMDSSKNFTCFDGSHSIPFAYVNDDYCDCLEGSDEPGTSACPSGTFFCENIGHLSKIVPSSRVNDGFCDCCDASDEYLTGKCANNCIIHGSISKQLRTKTDQIYIIGNQIRLQLIAVGQRLKKEREQTLIDLEKKKHSLSKALEEKEYKKNMTETRKLEVLKSIGWIKSLKEERELEEMNVANKIFTVIDANNDDKLQLKEMQQKPIFDEDKDGVVSDEELQYFVDSSGDISRTVFIETVWPKLKRLYLLDKLDSIHSAKGYSGHDIIREVEIVKENKERTAEQNKTQITAQYNETVEILQQADRAHLDYINTQNAFNSIVKDLNSVKKGLSRDYGSKHEFALLEGQCFDYFDDPFYYKICPYDKVVQATRKDGPETMLGTWAGWLDNEYKIMIYNKGEICWKDHQRSVKVEISCGLTNEINRVLEPTKCEYIFEFKTPAACKFSNINRQTHDEL